jgi:hypothetical protein
MMRKTDENIEKRIDEILEYGDNIPKVGPPVSFASDVMKRFEEEKARGKVVSMNFMPYIRIAAAMIVFAIIGNLFILITSIKKADVTGEMYTAYSSEYNIDNEDQWWVSLASGDYYVMDETSSE